MVKKMKNINDVVVFIEKEIETLKGMIVKVDGDDDELLDDKVSMRSSLICSFGEQITLLECIKNFIKDCK